ncbi:MAG: hypothetical protein KC621_10110, partial [Myxococcales bacterium]|nr:hypothetical protein [Myxococcales bacterium]
MLLGWTVAANAAPCEGFEALVREAAITVPATCDATANEWVIEVAGHVARPAAPTDRDARDECVLLLRSLASASLPVEEPPWPT